MVNLVKTIELLLENMNNEKLMKTLTKQLRTSGKDINKLKKSSLFCNSMLAPIHAALFTNSPRVFKLVLDTKGLEVNSICTFRGDKYDILDLAAAGNGNIEILKLILEKIEIPMMGIVEIDGHIVPRCIDSVVLHDRLDMVRLFLTKTEKYPLLTPFSCLVSAIAHNHCRIFSHVLQFIGAGVLMFFDKKPNLMALCEKYNRTHLKLRLTQVLLTNLKEEMKIKQEELEENEKRLVEIEEKENILEELKVNGNNLEELEENENKPDEKHNVLQKCEDSLEKIVDKFYQKDNKLEKNDNKLEEKDDRSERNSDKINNDDDARLEKTLIVKSKVKKKGSRICWNCAEKGTDVALYKCAGCRKAYYCDGECQAEDWDVHGEYCMLVMERRKSKLLGS